MLRLHFDTKTLVLLEVRHKSFLRRCLNAECGLKYSRILTLIPWCSVFVYPLFKKYRMSSLEAQLDSETAVFGVCFLAALLSATLWNVFSCSIECVLLYVFGNIGKHVGAWFRYRPRMPLV